MRFGSVREIAPVGRPGLLRRLRAGVELGAELLEAQVGPVSFYVQRLSDGRLAWSSMVHDMTVREGLLDLEQVGDDPDNPAHWRYVLTDKGRAAAEPAP